MDSDEVGKALRQVNTSCAWSTLPAVLKKVNKKLPTSKQISERELSRFLLSVDVKELHRSGVWIVSFGANYMPIVLTNPAYARARTKHDEGGEQMVTCTCQPTTASTASTTTTKRYFNSSDYNAGRHSTSLSGHKPNCLCWTPPSSGHLHSWRRGFTE
eukprot:m.5905 g.5905  ORF g.5905 m.5905 type:complete len:158 (+) comp4742_c0_seq1:152-625(+)